MTILMLWGIIIKGVLSYYRFISLIYDFDYLINHCMAGGISPEKVIIPVVYWVAEGGRGKFLIIR